MRPRWRQSGFSLLSAIFILVVVSLVAAAMLSLAAAERRTSSFGLLGMRAYHASRSGIEWAVAKVTADPNNCAAGTFALTEGGLASFTVTVSCAFTAHQENTVTVHVFRITSIAEWGAFGNADYVSRRIEATATLEL